MSIYVTIQAPVPGLCPLCPGGFLHPALGLACLPPAAHRVWEGALKDAGT